MRFAPFGAAAMLGLLIITGRTWVAVGIAVVLFGIVQARMVSPAFKRTLEAGLARTAHAIARGVGLALSWILLTLVFAVFMVPVAILGLLFRRPMGRPRHFPRDGWIPREALSRSVAPPRMFGTEPTRARVGVLPQPQPQPAVVEPAQSANPPTSDSDPVSTTGPTLLTRAPSRRRVPRVVTALGVVAALLLLDLAVGAVLTAAGMPPDDRGDTARDVQEAVRTTMASPAIADEPWVEEYGESLIDYQLAGETYVPFLVRDSRAYESRYLNTTDTERVSYNPVIPEGVDPVRIAFFGGSVMFGVGQRDDHTIPSEVARQAEDEGIPVEVHNYGLPGWVGWQEMQYLERLLAAGEEYDLVVFYDGFNEFLVQYTGYSVDPTHLGVSTMNVLARDYQSEHSTPPGPGDALAEIGGAYARHSAVGRLLDRFAGDEPLGEGELRADATLEQQTDAALDIYDRAAVLATDLAEDRDTSVRFFWQPTKAGWPPEVTDRLPDGVTDLSRALDDREDEFYIDEVHTNEAGARVMAEALWDELRPDIEQADARGR